MKIKKLIIITIMILSTFTIVKAEQIENRYVPNIWSCSAKNDSCKYPYSGDYGGFYKDVVGNSIFYYFYTPITFTKGKYTKAYIPITITDPNATYELADTSRNGYRWIYEIRDGIFVRAQWKNTNGGELSSLCIATAFQNNNSIIYECNIPTEAVAFNYLNVNYKMTSTHGNYAEVVVKFGVADTIEFAIDSSTTTNNELNNIESTMSQDHTYNNNASENIQGGSTINNYEQAEENLLNGLDFSGANQQVNINPNSNNFIWNIVEALRTINGKIVLLMTSILGMGIMKMILNR